MLESESISKTNVLKKWEIREQQYLIDNKWIKVRQDSVFTGKGIEIPDFYIIEYPNCINIIAITEDEEFILVRQYRHGIGEIHYELCAGNIENGENPLDAAKRELLEETGYCSDNWELYMKCAVNPSMITTFCYTYIARDVKRVSTQNLETTEDIDVYLLCKDELIQKINNGDIIQGIMLAPLLKFLNNIS